LKARKIVQLHMNSGTHAALVALCEDGSLWQRSLDALEQPWTMLPEIPAKAPASVDAPKAAAVPKPANTGQRWGPEHDAYLEVLWHRDKKLCAEIGELMQRTEGAISARLAHLEIFPDREAARVADQARRDARAAAKTDSA
jgi:hypothetical protein